MILSKKRARVDNDSGILPLATPELRGARSPATRDDRRPRVEQCHIKGGSRPSRTPTCSRALALPTTPLTDH